MQLFNTAKEIPVKLRKNSIITQIVVHLLTEFM